MNWEAVGSIAELVGSIAVLATLIYLSIQLKKTQEIAQAQSIDNSRLFELEQSNQLIAHAELIEKANEGKELNVVEERVLNTLLNTRARNSFLDYVSSTYLGKGNAPYVPLHFGNFIANNPGFHQWWVRYRDVTRVGGSEIFNEWLASVEERVKRNGGT